MECDQASEHLTLPCRPVAAAHGDGRGPLAAAEERVAQQVTVIGADC